MALYVYIFRCLVEAGLLHDATKLADAIHLLEIERETWRQLCQQTAIHHRADPAETVPSPASRAAAPLADGLEPYVAGSFSLEA